jgi:hypothetical protein
VSEREKQTAKTKLSGNPVAFFRLLHRANLVLFTFLHRFEKQTVTTKREDLAEWGVVNPLYESKTLSGGDQVFFPFYLCVFFFSCLHVLLAFQL